MPDWTELIRRNLPLEALTHDRREEITAEIANQLEESWIEARARGLTEAEAEREALTRLGEWNDLAEHLDILEHGQREKLAGQWFDAGETVLKRRGGVAAALADLGRDIGYSLRSFRRSPGFVFVAVVSLALGIGVNSAIFSLFESIFLRSLPVEAPEELMEIYWSGDDFTYGPFSYPDYLDLRRLTEDVFSDLITYDISIGVHESDGHSEYVFGEAVTANYFSAFGIVPALGRFFIDGADDEPGAEPTIVLGHQTWQERYGGDRDVLGQSFRLNGVEYRIVGVAPAQFTGMLPMTSEIWVPITHDPMIGGGLADLMNRETQFLFSVKGRRRPGVGQAEASAVIQAAEAAIHELHSGDYHFTVVAVEDIGVHGLIDTPVRLFLQFLMVMVGLALLIACTNLAGMLLARATARRREIAVRLALGSSRWRLVRQLLAESLLLALAGGAAGLAVAWVLQRALMTFQPPLPIPINLDLGLNAGVVLFTGAVAVVTGIVFGLLPAAQSIRTDLVASLKSRDSFRGGRQRFHLRRILVVGQVAVSTLLLICTGLFLRSLASAGSTDPGFATTQGFTVLFESAVKHSEPETIRRYFHQMRERIAALPGVEEAALITSLPLGAGIANSHISDADREEEDGAAAEADVARIGVNYFTTMGIPLLSGRSFEAGDTEGARPVAVINETLARRLWADANPIGRRLRVGFTGETVWEVVGVARNGKYRTLGERPRGFIYLPFEQSFSSRMSIVARTSGPPAPLLPLVYEEARAVDPDIPVFEAKTIHEHLEIMLFVPRLLATLLGGLGLLALLLGLIGLYGTVSFDVARRMHEVGVRIALGAEHRDVLGTVMREGLRLVVIGLAVGLVTAFALGGALASLLIGVRPSDPATYLFITVIFLGVGVAATWGPARRAAAADPVALLRDE